MKDIQIYQNRDGSLRLDVAIEEDTVWLSQQQMIKLFERDQSVISRHINNVFKEQEVDKLTNMQKMHIANSDKPVSFYSLDVIISVGYRVKSQQGVKFRQWATQTLKNYLLRGYAVDKERFTKNALELEQALALIKTSINTVNLDIKETKGLAEIVTRYTQTFLWLQRYDEGLLDKPTGELGGILFSPLEAMSALNDLKCQLIQRGEATPLFAQ